MPAGTDKRRINPVTMHGHGRAEGLDGVTQGIGTAEVTLSAVLDQFPGNRVMFKRGIAEFLASDGAPVVGE